MTAFEIISIFIGILALLMSFGSLFTAFVHLRHMASTPFSKSRSSRYHKKIQMSRRLSKWKMKKFKILKNIRNNVCLVLCFCGKRSVEVI